MSFVTTFDLSYLLNHVYMYICRSALILFCHANCRGGRRNSERGVSNMNLMKGRGRR